jgi:outer membrane protein assembly factor BamB
VPDWSGNLWCLDAVTGAVIWQKKISDLVFAVDPNPYPKAPNSTIISRTSPVIAGSMLVSNASRDHVNVLARHVCM